MRQDMAQVLVERPRFGSSLPSRKKGYRKQLQKTAVAELPRREPMLGLWRGRQRFLNEHLGPMRRFLRSNVGRPWNKVHQDLCEHVSFNNAVQKHVLAHVFDYVQRGGILVHAQGRRRGCALPVGQLYICPTSGILKIVRDAQPQALPDRIHLDSSRMCLLRERAWWEVRVRKLPDDPEEYWDVWLERRASRATKAQRIAAYGGELLATSKRALTRAETRQLLRQRQTGRNSARRRTNRWGPCPDR